MHLDLFVCLSVCLSGCNYRSDLLDFTQDILRPWLSPLVRSSGSRLNNVSKDSSPLRDRTKCISKVRHNAKRALR